VTRLIPIVMARNIKVCCDCTISLCSPPVPDHDRERLDPCSWSSLDIGTDGGSRNRTTTA
jgi:hypothetical protein